MKRIILILCLVFGGCVSMPTTDPLASLETAAVKAYRDAAALVVLGSMSKEDGAKALEEGGRLAKQYAAVAIIRGLPQESQAVKDARAELVAALK